MQLLYKQGEQKRLQERKEAVIIQKNIKTENEVSNVNNNSQGINPREAFIKRLQKKLVKNQIEKSGGIYVNLNGSSNINANSTSNMNTNANESQKSSSQNRNEEIFKSHLAKISYLTNRRAEKKTSVFHNYLLKDLCEQIDNQKSSPNTTQTQTQTQTAEVFLYFI